MGDFSKSVGWGTGSYARVPTKTELSVPSRIVVVGKKGGGLVEFLITSARLSLRWGATMCRCGGVRCAMCDVRCAMCAVVVHGVIVYTNKLNP